MTPHERATAMVMEKRKHNLMVDIADVEWVIKEAERDLRLVLEDVYYCVTCWDNPSHNLCDRHLAPVCRALGLPLPRRHGPFWSDEI